MKLIKLLTIPFIIFFWAKTSAQVPTLIKVNEDVLIDLKRLEFDTELWVQPVDKEIEQTNEIELLCKINIKQAEIIQDLQSIILKHEEKDKIQSSQLKAIIKKSKTQNTEKKLMLMGFSLALGYAILK